MLTTGLTMPRFRPSARACAVAAAASLAPRLCLIRSNGADRLPGGARRSCCSPTDEGRAATAWAVKAAAWTTLLMKKEGLNRRGKSCKKR
jgi:hypothetical protein